MSSGLYSGVSGLAIGAGLNKGVSGLWGGASGLVRGGGGETVSGLSITATKVGVDEAPQGVHFVATALGVSDQADVVVVWDFGDTYQFRYLPADTKANDRQSGTSIGHRVGHDYKSAGTYTVTATAYQFVGGLIVSASQTTEVVVAAQDLAFTETVCISKTGSFAGAPAGATQVLWSSISTAGIRNSPYTLGQGRRVLFEAGQDFQWTGTQAFATGWSALDTVNPPVKLGRFGSGNNPRILADGAFVLGNTRVGKLSIVDVDFVGAYDCTANLNWENTSVYPTPPTQPRDIFAFLANSSVPGVIAEYYVSGCRISGGYINVHISAAGLARAFIADNDITNWGNFGVYGLGTEAACIVGNRIEQGAVSTNPVAGNPAQRSWNSPGLPNTPRHGPVRVEGGRNYTINSNFIRSYRNGWSQTPGTDGVAAIQSAVRLTTTGFPDDVNSFTVSQNDLIGGIASLSATSTDFSGGPAQGRVVCGVAESNYLAPDDGRTAGFFAVSFPSLHVRSNVAHWPASEPIVANALPSSRNFQASPGTTGTAPGTIHFYSNTMIFDGDLPAINWVQTTESAPGNANSTQFAFENQIVQMRGAYNAATTTDFYKINFDPLEAGFPFDPKFGSLAYGGYMAGRLSALAFGGVTRSAPFSIGAGEESGEPVVTVTIDQATVSGGNVLGTNVTETATIVFAGSAPALLPGGISYSWLVDGNVQADGFVLSGGQTVRARATFTHATGSQTVLSAPVTVLQGAVAAPTLTGTPTLVGSWDFNDASKITLAGSKVASISGSDGTSVTLAEGTDANRPTLTRIESDGFNVGVFTAASSTKLTAASGLGAPAQALTFVAICRPTLIWPNKSPGTTNGLLLTQRDGGLTGRERKGLALLMGGIPGTNAGWAAFNSGTTANAPASANIQIATTKTLAIAVAGPLANGANLHLDGRATPFTRAITGVDGAAMNLTVLGAQKIGASFVDFADAEVYRVLVYASALNATQLEEVAVWAAANYGTANVA